jgi:hypothetical protein
MRDLIAKCKKQEQIAADKIEQKLAEDNQQSRARFDTRR